MRSTYRKFSYKAERVKMNKSVSQIDKDLKRTIIPHVDTPQYKELYYRSLKHVLTAYTNFNVEVGYVQGMNIIVSCIMYNVCNTDYANIESYEQISFWLFVSLMEHYEIKNCFSKNMKKIFDLSADLENLLQKNIPEVLFFINSGDVRLLVQHFCLLREFVFYTGSAHSAHRAV